MVTEIIPEDVRQFILQNIESVAQLEGLLLLRGDETLKLSSEFMSERLYISKPEATELLDRLQMRGLLVKNANTPPLYWYSPVSQELDQIVEKVSQTYARYLVPVTHLVHSKTTTRIQEFADAFWIRKDT